MAGRRIARWLHAADPWMKICVVLSAVVYMGELLTGAPDTHHSHPFFVWAERFFALVFTIEYFARWYDDATDSHGWHYPHSPLGIVDLVSVLPFWVGAVAAVAGLPMSVEFYHWIRTFRIFRFLKFARYSRNLQLTALAYYRAWPHVKPLAFSLGVIGLFCVVAMYEAEQAAQPEKFDSLFSTIWFTAVTVTTVGYGDIAPITPTGRAIAMLTLGIALTLFAGFLGIIGSMFVKVMEEEVDPEVDPLQLYTQEKERHRRVNTLERDFGPKYTGERASGATGGSPPGATNQRRS